MHPSLHSPSRRSLGFSLIELMIGLVIGMVVVSAGVMVYVSNRVTSEAVTEQNRMESTSRFLSKLGASSFNSAGFFGCQTRGGRLQNNINSNTTFLHNYAQSLFAFESNGTAYLNGPLPAVLSGATPAPVASVNSDVLVIRTALGPVLSLDAAQAAPSSAGDVWVRANNYLGTLGSNSVAMITNCSRATVFMNTAATACTNAGSCRLQHAAGATPAPGNATAPLGFNYGYDAEVVIPTTISYYVATSSRCAANSGGNCPSNSLYRMVGSNAPEELAENIQAMKVRLLSDPGLGMNSGTARLNPSGVANWNQVVGLSVEFLITSSKPVLPQAKTTVFNGANITDKMARRSFVVNASLRNAMP